MTKKQTYTLLEGLHQEYYNINSKLPYLNCGGCGIFAEHLYGILVELGYKPTLVVITNSANGMDELIEGKIKWVNCDANIKHIVIAVNGVYMDSKVITQAVKGFGYSVCSETTDKLSIEVLKKWNRDLSMWNDTFNRNEEYLIVKRLHTAKNNIKKKKEELFA
jgi:hypothetical protein